MPFFTEIKIKLKIHVEVQKIRNNQSNPREKTNNAGCIAIPQLKLSSRVRATKTAWHWHKNTSIDGTE